MSGALQFDVHQILPDGSTSFLATLDNAKAKSIRPELNGIGSGSFTLNRSDESATTDIMARGNLVKVSVPSSNPDPMFSFFLEEGDFELISSDEDGGEDLQFSGHGGFAYWDRAIWLSETFSLPWWPACLTGGPPAGATGAVDVKAGRYRFYNVTGSPGVIDATAPFVTTTVAAFCASFDSRRTYQWPAEKSKRMLVQLLDGPHAGSYFHPHQDGVTEYLASKSQGFRSGVPLTEVGATPGAVLKYLFDEATAAGRPVAPIPLMTVDFTDALDSDGNAWNTSDALAGLTANVGDYYIETLGQLLGTGVIDMVMGPDLDMHAYNAYGRDLAGPAFGVGVVRFERGVNIAVSLGRNRGDGPAATFAEVIGSEDTYARALLPDAATRIAREVSVQGASTDPATLQAIGLADLELRLARGEAVAFPFLVGGDEEGGTYRPGPAGMGDVWIGDTVRLHTGTKDEVDFNETDVRVTAMTLSENEAGELLGVIEAATGPLPIMGSVGVVSPTEAAQGDCNCPCDLGTPVPDTTPTAYYGEMYGPSFAGVSTGTSDPDEEFQLKDQSGATVLTFVPGTMIVFVNGVMVVPGAYEPLPNAIPVPGDVYLYARVACPPEGGGGIG